jgi:hypothetical protein
VIAAWCIALATRSFRSVAEYPSVCVARTAKLSGELASCLIFGAIAKRFCNIRVKICIPGLNQKGKFPPTHKYLYIFASTFVRRFDIDNLREYVSRVHERMKGRLRLGSTEENDPFCIGCCSASRCYSRENEQFCYVASAEKVSMLRMGIIIC